MTYLRFHLLFNLPLLVVLAASTCRAPWTPDELRTGAIVLAAVMLFTTPWDNLAAKWGIWGFPPGRYTVRVGYLPIEEYAFFILQSINVMLAVRAIFHFLPDWQTGQETSIGKGTLLCLAASVVGWLVVALQLRLVRRKGGTSVNYAIHLSWFLPVLYTQWVLAPFLFFEHARMLLLIMTGFGVYYTLADLVAVRSGIWHFDERQIIGVKLAGLLPWEEIAFFFLTSLLVAQSYLLLLPSDLR